jgi:hypothetical protein
MLDPFLRKTLPNSVLEGKYPPGREGLNSFKKRLAELELQQLRKLASLADPIMLNRARAAALYKVAELAQKRGKLIDACRCLIAANEMDTKANEQVLRKALEAVEAEKATKKLKDFGLEKPIGPEKLRQLVENFFPNKKPEK